MLREVNTKTGGRKATDVKGDVVKMRHTTLHKASGKHYELETTFVFTGVGAEAILRMAAEFLLIRWRGAFKGSDTVTDADDRQVVKVIDMLSRSRVRTSPVAKVTKLVSGLTDAERRELIASLQE